MENILLILLLLKCHVHCEAEDSRQCRNTKVAKYLFLKQDSLSYTNSILTYFTNFESFSDLELPCNQTYNATSFVQLNPNRQLIVDKTFSLRNQLLSENAHTLDTLVFSNVKGFDFNSKMRRYRVKHLVLVFSHFDFYLNSEILSECSQNVYKHLSNFHLLRSFGTIYFRQVVYPTSMCPLGFR